MTKLEDLKVNIEEVKNEYIQKLEEIKAKIEELEDEMDNRWKPKVFEDYWWVSGRGFARRDKCLNSKYDEDVFNHTDVFPTEEQAEFDRERKRIRRELMKYGNEFKTGEDNWALRYDHDDDAFITYYAKYIQTPFTVYFESDEIMRKAIEKVGEDRIKKYLFGVK